MCTVQIFGQILFVMLWQHCVVVFLGGTNFHANKAHLNLNLILYTYIYHIYILNILFACVVCVSGDSAAQTGCSESDSGHAEGSAGLHGAGPLPPPLSHSVQSDDLTTVTYSSYC